MGVLVPITIWTFRSVWQLYRNIPGASLKTPAILIFMGPFMVQVCYFVITQMEHESAIVLVQLAAKLYIVVLFYSFYFLIREVVYFEHLL